MTTIETKKRTEKMTTEATIKTINIKNQSFMLSISSYNDVQIAYSYKKDQTGDWIYGVDPETYGEIKSIWLQLNKLDLSIYNVFCIILKSL
jgi:hypothetical protein